MNTHLTACIHLQPLERELRAANLKIEYEGASWWNSGGSGIWMYFHCYLKHQELRARLQLPLSVEYHEYDGRVAGQEAGFVCTSCGSAVVGVHLNYNKDVPHV